VPDQAFPLRLAKVCEKLSLSQRFCVPVGLRIEISLLEIIQGPFINYVIILGGGGGALPSIYGVLYSKKRK